MPYTAKKFIVFFLGLCLYSMCKTLIYINETTPPRQEVLDPPWIPLTTVAPAPGVDVPENRTSVAVTVASAKSKEYECQHDLLLKLPPFVKGNKCVGDECVYFTCNNFLYGNGTQAYYEKSVKWMKEHKKVIKPEGDLKQLAKDCVNFCKGYHMNPVNEEEASFPIAFNILMHTDVEQIEVLLRAIYRPQNIYCIHIDQKSSPSIVEAIQAISNCLTNVFIVSKRERVVYAGFSRLQADINCMSDLTKTQTQWKYLINIAGQSFPLKTNAEMVKVLKIYNGANDIEGIYGHRVLKSRFQNEWIESGIETAKPSMKKTGELNPPTPYDIDIVRGSAYGIFSRKFVEYLLNDPKPRSLLFWSRKTWSPDEHYWATLHHTYSNPHLKPPGGYSGMPNEKPWLAVYAAWGGVDKCHGQWRHGVCVFGVGDLPNLLKRREFFANKFYIDSQPLALECLANWLEHKVKCPPPFDDKYYKSLPFINDGRKAWER
jgi:hypothetical protein